jgi:hypothetical protein
MPFKTQNRAALLALLGAALFSSGARAESAHYDCSWIKNVALPFTLTVQNATTYINGSLGIFGQVTATVEQGDLYIVQLELPGGAAVFRWPKAGGQGAVGFFNSQGQLQGGHPAAATCKKR